MQLLYTHPDGRHLCLLDAAEVAQLQQDAAAHLSEAVTNNAVDRATITVPHAATDASQGASMPQQPHPSAAITVTCPLCDHSQPLDPSKLQDLQVVTSEPAKLQSITARLTCAGCGRDFVIALKPNPEAQPTSI